MSLGLLLVAVLTDGLRPVLEGIVIGLIIATAARLILNSVNPAMVESIAAVTSALAYLPLVLAALVACYLPAGVVLTALADCECRDGVSSKRGRREHAVRGSTRECEPAVSGRSDVREVEPRAEGARSGAGSGGPRE